jgi:hypothetical protein
MSLNRCDNMNSHNKLLENLPSPLFSKEGSSVTTTNDKMLVLVYPAINVSCRISPFLKRGMKGDY